ncbi:unnamed protein product [Paramecium sonneborni]|uniref:P-type ATPase A domain-containing protein n=1 Tax=Paramecium sonneborni TaxID=65129 RepID=A0A8S1P0L1_9CILI|nr:unnamed protein product [Paramecium sonneborni]
MIELPILGDKVEDTQTSEYFVEFNERYELKVYYYEEDNNFMIKILRIISLGLFSLFEKWFVQVQLLSFQKSTEPSHLLIQKLKDGKRMSKDQIVQCKRDGDRIKFKYEYINFLITPQNQLQKLEMINYDYHELTKYEAQQRQILYGENIMQVEECTKSQILLNEILSPFNIFQLFSFIVWSLDDYYLYAILIAILTIIQIVITLYDLEKQNHKIREMIYYENAVIVHRDHHQLKISSKDLVPGDIVQITAKSMITFDGLLTQGEAVFNEAILTGESTPILKTINIDIFSGCSCLSASSDCKALVKSIGFNTVKGSLARYILFNNSYSYSFQKESLKYLLVIGFLGILLSIANYFIRLNSTSNQFESFIQALEIITIMIPPSLPTALGAGLQVAVQRLKTNNIFCIKPDKINVSGMVNLIGFDKTGTLTESTLKVLGCVEKKLLQNANHCKEMMQLALKSCHTLIGGCGDNLEIAMLECCQQNFDFEYQKVYQFESNLQRMTVIIKYKGKLLAITKGSPEIMERLCFKTLPDQFGQTIKQYLEDGYRLISFGYREINNVEEERKYIENGLEYLGTLVFANHLREDSKNLIELLNSININSIMVTGDNILTSINIAKQCQILDPNQPVITGQMIDDKLVFDNNVNREEIEEMNYQVALTGDAWDYVDKYP